MNDDDLRRLLDAPGDGAGPDCPEPDVLWALCTGALSPERVDALLVHTARCDACREALAAARRGVEGLRAEAPARRPALGALALVAAVLLVAVGLFALRDDPGSRDGAAAPGGANDEAGRTGPVRQGLPGDLTWSDLGGATPLPRDAFDLAWKPVEGAASYVVEVFDPDLDRLARSPALQRPAWRVPADALSSREGGDAVFWRVEARLRSGALARSPVFRAEIAR